MFHRFEAAAPHAVLQRSLFGQAIIAAAGSVAAGPLLAREPSQAASPNALLAKMEQSTSGSVRVVQLWPTLTENFYRAAMLSRCEAFKQPLSEREWDAGFQSRIAEDASQLMKTPTFQRFFWKPWAEQITKEWNALPAAKQVQWARWLAKPEADKVLQSLRAEVALDACTQPDWMIDARTGAAMATPVILLAQAWSDLNVRELMDRAITQADPALGKLWARVKPFAAMKSTDAPMLQQIAKALPEHNDKIFENFNALATKQMQDRKLWNDGPFSDIPGQCGYVLKGGEARAFQQAAFTFRPADYVPHTMAAFCGTR